MNTRYGRNVCQDLANLSDNSVSGVRFSRMASKYAKAVQERKALEASYLEERKINLPQAELVKQRLARELEAANEARLSNQPVASVFDAYSLAKGNKSASSDAGLRALTAQLERMWNKDRSASLSAKSYKALYDHYRRNFPKSAAASVLEEIGHRGYTTLPVSDLARIASGISTQSDFEEAMLYHGLSGKAPHQVKARQYILALLNEEKGESPRSTFIGTDEEEGSDDDMEANAAEDLLNHLEEMEEILEDFAEEEGFEVEEEDDEYEGEEEESRRGARDPFLGRTEARRAQMRGEEDEGEASATETYVVLSIDAWGNEADGWDWNDLSMVGEVELPQPENIQHDLEILKALVEAGIASEKILSKCEVDDSDGIQWVVQSREDGQPLWSIRYDGVEASMLDPFAGRRAADSSDPLMEEELFSFILTYSNEGQELAGRRQAIESSLKKKLDKGIYDTQLATQGFMVLVEDGIQTYARDFYGKNYGSGQNLLSPQSRMNVAAMLVEEFEENNSGNDEESTGDMGFDEGILGESRSAQMEGSDQDSAADVLGELDWNLYMACLKEIGAGGIAEYFFRYLDPVESNMVLKSLIRENKLYTHTDPETGEKSLTEDSDQGNYSQNLLRTVARSASNSRVFVAEVLRRVKPSKVSSLLMRMALTRRVSYRYQSASRRQAVDALQDEFAQQQQSESYMIDPPLEGTLAFEVETWAGKSQNDASQLAKAWLNGNSVPGELVLGAVSFLDSLKGTLNPDGVSAVDMLIGELQDHVMEQKRTDRSVQGRTFQALLHCVACGW